ncbi:hypothetical protein C9374_000285 [Naegleria lovaniensis]|uniref:KOW domain-containing protein n=1 Tax=Naegleria lovaniensis TaxID=51637 RepID=A0AA88GUV9_NAELO|nr:uncharacterized protein C9374_000285 [Naegleria lovaniensis]KAG2388846.1 hypothetical protein C9374_000285 [Naegleria lovaniensis]
MVSVNNSVSSKRSKARKAHFTAPSSVRRVIMSAPLTKKLRDEHNVRAVPIRKGDEVKILKGKFKGVVGKVKKVVRLKWSVYVEGVQGEKLGGKTFDVAVKPSTVQITKLHLDKDRKNLLKRKAEARAQTTQANKGKFTEETVKQQ